VNVLAPGVCRITTSRATFSVHDIDDLADIMAADLNGQLLACAEGILKDNLDEVHQSRLFKDELENEIRIDLDTTLQ
jgi:hypothetical protein